MQPNEDKTLHAMIIAAKVDADLPLQPLADYVQQRGYSQSDLFDQLDDRHIGVPDAKRAFAFSRNGRESIILEIKALGAFS